MTKEQVFDVVKKVVMEILPDVESEQISMEKSLKDLGANSIDRMEVTTRSMEELGLELPQMTFAKVGNIEGLVEVLSENCIAGIKS
ncbi:MAG: acyl carrier protein [Chitinivibrionales bacterium]|nr:acyl carrier protein [Chitinivibrionales bacterium]MBD3357092.1 acyl carrier protein [Chitinivibrionales bacterium]